MMKRYDKHIFVCENKRPPDDPRGCCADKGSLEIRAKMKQRIKQLGLNSKVRVNSSGCLDSCEFGPSIVIYPEEIWYCYVKEEDIEEIVQSHIINNKPVERLLNRHPKFNRDKNGSEIKREV